jgi:hypothetical protein
MSNIFYSEVDPNLQAELNARGQAGGQRKTADLNWMLGKVANAEVRAYEGNSIEKPVDSPYAVLGGQSVLESRFQPNTYLSNQTYEVTNISYDTNGRAYLRSDSFNDSSHRVAPYITDVSVAIGDHSMGLLNKATIKIEIPNPQRDLDGIEDVWLRPGRYVQIKIAYPESAVITKLHLSSSSLPNEAALKAKYPTLFNDNKLQDQISRINEYSFIGLITSFTFNYTDAGFVEASLSLTGTSNSYTDVSMFIPTEPEDKNEAKITPKPEKPVTAYDIGIVTAQSATTASTLEHSADKGVPNFYELFNKSYESQRTNYIKITNNNSGLIAWDTKTTNTDQFILFGDLYNQTKKELEVELNVKNQLTASGSASIANTADDIFPNSTYSRYITLAALIDFINITIIKPKFENDTNALIMCDDIQCSSTYYDNVVSSNPMDVLFVSKTLTEDNAGSHYGDLKFFEGVKKPSEKWQGYVQSTANSKVIKPSRIFINEQVVKRVYDMLNISSKGRFLLKEFIKNILSSINTASGGTIELNLVTSPDPQFANKLSIVDSKYLKPIDLSAVETAKVPYSVPMFANHPAGSIVSDFKFDASLPESAKNLSYVLNQGTEISDDDIAPHMNFMYNSKNVDDLNKLIDDYKNRHTAAVKNLAETRAKIGFLPRVKEMQSAYAGAIKTYLKFPTPDINKSKQMTAPIFPFSVQFTIDGVNGLRYGDILTFDALPTKYKVNTVFSIIGITHTISSDGQWTTEVRCIMRPAID